MGLILESLLLRAMPPTGRRRTGDDRLSALPPAPAHSPAVPMRRPLAPGPLLCGEDYRLVRPYVVVAEKRRQAQDRRLTRAVRCLAEERRLR